jgi:triphosphoribosyl-dephospho-CoA synthase
MANLRMPLTPIENTQRSTLMSPLSIGQCVTLACLLEATAPKPGNVHRGADFDDLSFTDFAVSAVAIGPALESAKRIGVGPAVLQAIQATRALVSSNTNLGMVLLLTPLAAVPRGQPLQSGVAAVLSHLKPEDTRCVYEAIRLAAPGGMGQVDEMDIADTPPQNLLDAMRAAAERDSIAKQYRDDYADVFRSVLPWLVEGRATGLTLTQSIIHVQVRLLSQLPDSLIARKCGAAVAQQASDFAAGVLRAGNPFDEAYNQALHDFDFWLRSDGHRRNPGATADLLAAGLFAALRDGLIQPPFH